MLISWLIVTFILSFITALLIDIEDYKMNEEIYIDYGSVFITLSITGLLVSIFTPVIFVIASALALILEKVLLKEVIIKHLNK